MIPVQLAPLSLAVVVVAIFAAGIIRGYSGFGFAMVAVTATSLVLPPRVGVPLVLILELFASLQLLPSAWSKVDFRSLRWLLAGSVLAIPAGVYLLAKVPAAPMRAAISVLVMLAAVLLLVGWRWQRMPGRTLSLSTGLASGLLNGAAAIGGPPVILFYFSSPAGVTVSRASLIAYFLALDALSLAMALTQGLITRTSFLLTLLCLPPLFAGIYLGNRLFTNADQESFRRRVLVLLIVLAAAGLIRAGYG